MWQRLTAIVVGISLALPPLPLTAQNMLPEDSVLHRIWALGMDSTQTYTLAQALLDSIGPRLTGSPQQAAAIEWALSRFALWGVVARKEPYGTYHGWRRGYTHVDLVTPRIRTLEGTMLAWSPGTRGKDVEGDVVLPPTSASEIETWLATSKGKYVLMSPPQATCRPAEDWSRWAMPGSRPGRPASLPTPPKPVSVTIDRLEAAGVAGLLTQAYFQYDWGVFTITDAKAKQVPAIRLSCEDYGLVYRLAEHKQGPRLRVNAQAQSLGEVPVYNVLAEMKGVEKPAEYVMLIAHLDSWDGASGAIDNGTGCIMMMEAMRILKAAYPKPKRTILVGLFNGEEQGIFGANAYVKAHPDVVEGLHALFNHDAGTGHIAAIYAGPFAASKEYVDRWLRQIPDTFTRKIKDRYFSNEANGGTDHQPFVQAGAPWFYLYSPLWSYENTHHTNRDTFDKISFDDLKANATIVAMLAYLASEDAVKFPRK